MTKEEQIIEAQRSKLKKGNPELSLLRPCKIGDGIISLNEAENKAFEAKFEKSDVSSSLFVPASGSGSRMFEFLFDYLQSPNEETRGKVERFLANARNFAFFHKLPLEIQQKVADLTIDMEEFVAYLLSDSGLNYGSMPKGLIPFHQLPPFVLNPFQEHVLQGLRINPNMRFHFTIQPEFEMEILASIKQLEGIALEQAELNFSVQNPESDAYVFNEDFELVKDEGAKVIKRPSGHGALLPNLQGIDDQLIFVKNIDNVQLYTKSDKSSCYFKTLAGLLLSVKEQLKICLEKNNLQELKSLSDKFFLFTDEELNNYSSDMGALTNRPIRVCGMVKNDGQPGGGPFYVHVDGTPQKQIVEKAQIATDNYNHQLMLKSTHFNPVFMVLDIHDMNGQKYDLSKFRNEEHYFVVEKSQKGQKVQFLEQPGLWNGSMENWITLFVEIPNEIFSPVKTVLDLLESAHR
jgi:hypothetical protein